MASFEEILVACWILIAPDFGLRRAIARPLFFTLEPTGFGLPPTRARFLADTPDPLASISVILPRVVPNVTTGRAPSRAKP
jgi:hypothetical protein